MIVSTSVNFTSCTDSRIDADRSIRMLSSTDAGRSFCNRETIAFTSSATLTVFEPGCRCTASVIDRAPLNHEAARVFCTESITRPRSARRTGAPFRYATVSCPNAAALLSCPSVWTV